MNANDLRHMGDIENGNDTFEQQPLQKATHWILTRDRAQNIINNLGYGCMTLKAAKLYYSAYGVTIAARTKDDFIRRLCLLVQP